MDLQDRSVPPAGRHGRDGPAVARALGLGPGLLLDLSQNLNPFAPDVARFGRRQPHWSVGSLAPALLGDLLDHADLAGRAASIARAREDLVGVFEPRDFTVHTADAPWVLVQAPGLRESLAPHGVLVRDCTSFGLAGTARVTVPNAAGLERLAAALDNAGMAAPAGSAGNGASATTHRDHGGQNPAEPAGAPSPSVPGA